MYHRGTLEQFNIWHETVKIAEGITPAGKIGYVAGKSAPNNQRTTAYSEAIPHPLNENDYIWQYGNYPESEILTTEDVIAVGWFNSED